MATITINVSDDVDTTFRKTVAHEYGAEKGVLGKAVTEAIELWVTEKKQKDIAVRQLKLMEKGFSFGKFTFKRDEIYER
jgi:hypothetical protein